MLKRKLKIKGVKGPVYISKIRRTPYTKEESSSRSRVAGYLFNQEIWDARQEALADRPKLWDLPNRWNGPPEKRPAYLSGWLPEDGGCPWCGHDDCMSKNSYRRSFCRGGNGSALNIPETTGGPITMFSDWRDLMEFDEEDLD